MINPFGFVSRMSTLILNTIVHLPESSLCLVFGKLVEFAFDEDLLKASQDRNIAIGIKKQAKEILVRLMTYISFVCL